MEMKGIEPSACRMRSGRSAPELHSRVLLQTHDGVKLMFIISTYLVCGLLFGLPSSCLSRSSHTKKTDERNQISGSSGDNLLIGSIRIMQFMLAVYGEGRRGNAVLMA